MRCKDESNNYVWFIRIIDDLVNICTKRSLCISTKIETRDRYIIIQANKTYTVYSKDGEVLFENMTLESLQAKNPSLRELIERSLSEETIMMDGRIND